MFSTLADKEEKNRIRNLSPQAFENYIADIFKEKGFNVEVTPPTNDGGKDIVMTLGDKKFFVECKHYSDGAIGREAIQKLLGAGALERDVVGYFFVTSSYFNKNAIECGEKLDALILLDLDDIISLKKIPTTTFQSNINNHFARISVQRYVPHRLEKFILITDGLTYQAADIVKQTLTQELPIKHHLTTCSSYGVLNNNCHTISVIAKSDGISTYYRVRVTTSGKYEYIVRSIHIRNSTAKHSIELVKFISTIKDEILNNKYSFVGIRTK